VDEQDHVTLARILRCLLPVEQSVGLHAVHGVYQDDGRAFAGGSRLEPLYPDRLVRQERIGRRFDRGRLTWLLRLGNVRAGDSRQEDKAR
jgi:hypothetical protein